MENRCSKVLYMDSPLGILEICSNQSRIDSLRFVEEKVQREDSDELLNQASLQLTRYFLGQSHSFELPLSLPVSLFERKILEATRAISPGSTLTYREIAKLIGHPGAYRAAGNALHKNRVPILIPCHRVVGETRYPGGYAGGEGRKTWLLKHEQTYRDRYHVSGS